MIRIYPKSHIEGIIEIPPSKSYAQRALAASLLAKGISTLINIGDSTDELAVLSILKISGAEIEKFGNITTINSEFIVDKPLTINCGESGLATRLFTPIFANYKSEVSILGNGTLKNRKMTEFQSIFEQLKVSFHTNNDYLPFLVKGPIQIPDIIYVDGSISSQYITGLICILSSLEKQSSVIVQLKNPMSKPYISMTIDLLKKFGGSIEINDNQIVIDKSCKLFPTKYFIESDWSSASYWIVAAAISGKIEIKGLNQYSLQADREILSVLDQFGARYRFDNESFNVESNEYKPFEFDATDCPDLFPALVVLASKAIGTSKIHGVDRLFMKESNRALTLKSEFTKLGLEINIVDNSMIINGKGTLTGGIISSHYDHRIAMAGAIACLVTSDPIYIENHEVVTKSYPKFYEHLQSFGVKLTNQ